MIVGCKILEHENKVGEQLGVQFEFKMQLCCVKTTVGQAIFSKKKTNLAILQPCTFILHIEAYLTILHMESLDITAI